MDANNDYTFTEECDVCGNKPVYADLGMCAVCTHGEADAMWEWLYEDWKGKEGKLAQKYVIKTLRGIELFDPKTGVVNEQVAFIMHLDQEILDKIEELL